MPKPCFNPRESQRRQKIRFTEWYYGRFATNDIHATSDPYAYIIGADYTVEPISQTISILVFICVYVCK